MTERQTGPDTTYTLLPFVREGFRPNRPYDPSKETLDGRNEVTVRTSVEGRKRGGSGTETRSTEVDLRMYGPGDVTGIDDRQVIRTVPKAETATFPPNYFPHVEFYRPDLPWMFSPESASESEGEKLRPWMTLVVLPRDGDATMDPPGERPNPVLKVSSKSLPPIDESWAWAHAQAVGDVYGKDTDEADREQLFRRDTDQTVSRLVCPRKLSKGTAYRAFVVPTFEPGRKAGLGTAPFEDLKDGETPTIAPAWNSSKDETVELPVYYWWEFSTGDRGDFESALDKLAPRNLSKPKYEVGFREFDLSDPGPGVLRETDTVTAKMGGALTTVGVDTTDWDHSSDLYTVLTDPDRIAGTPPDSPARNLPIVGPPSYGQWPPMALDWPESPGRGSALEWLAELNLAPRYRVAAGLGTAVVRENQDQLMVDAWKQFDKLDDETRSILDRRKLGGKVEDEVKDDLEAVDVARKYRDIERVREAIRVQGALDRLHEDGALGEGRPGIVDPPGGGYGFGHDVGESILRNGGLGAGVEDLLDGIGGRGGFGGTPVDRTAGGDVTRAMMDDESTFLGLAKSLGETRRFREIANEPRIAGETRSDGGVGSVLPSSLPDFGSLSRLDAVTRSGGVLDRRTNDDVDLDGIRDALFSGEASQTGGETTRGATTRPADWLVDEDGNRMTLVEALESLPGDAKAVPKALIQLQSLRDDSRAIRSRLESIADALEGNDPGTVPAAAVRIALKRPAIDEQASLVRDLLDGGNRSLSKLVGSRLDAVSDELTPDRVESSFRRMNEAHEVLTTSVARIAAGARAAAEQSDDARRDGGTTPTIAAQDVERARRAADEIAGQSEALAAHVPTEVSDSSGSGTAPESLPDDRVDASTDLLYDGIPLQSGTTLPGLHAGEDWTVARTATTVFDADLSPGSMEGTKRTMIGDPMAAPEFDWPMYEPLKELSAENVLPGVGNVPNNTIGALETNRKFIEAYMAGLSHEFARELLWRGYPTDRRGTYFRTFWDYDGPGKEDAPHDVSAIHGWDDALGTNGPESGGGSSVSNRVVLLIKGDLLQAFPNTRIYAVPAVAEKRGDAPSPGDAESGHDIWDRKPLFEDEVFDPSSTPVYEKTTRPGAYTDGDESHDGAEFTTRDGKRHVVQEEPVVHGKLDDNVTFLLFDLDVDAARGKDFTFESGTLEPEHPDQLGWFFVFEEPVGEIRFGLDSNDEMKGPDERAIREASHPKDASGLYTDVGSYPAGIRLGTHQGTPIERGKDGVSGPLDGCEGWKEGQGEEYGWSGLSWGHLVRHGEIGAPKDDRPEQVEAEQKMVDDITYVRVAGDDSHAPGGVNDGVGSDAPWSTEDATWGENGAHMANVTWQFPVRGAYHVDDLLPDDSRATQSGSPDDLDWVDGGDGR